MLALPEVGRDGHVGTSAEPQCPGLMRRLLAQDTDHVTLGFLNDRHAWDVARSVPHVHHVFKRDWTVIWLHRSIHVVGTRAGLCRTLLDVEQEPRLLGE